MVIEIESYVHIYIEGNISCNLVNCNECIITCGLWRVVFNTLWPNDAIWRHRTWSTSAQVMAPIQYLNRCWFHLRAFPWEYLKIPMSKTRLKTAFFLNYFQIFQWPMSESYARFVFCCVLLWFGTGISFRIISGTGKMRWMPHCQYTSREYRYIYGFWHQKQISRQWVRNYIM